MSVLGLQISPVKADWTSYERNMFHECVVGLRSGHPGGRSWINCSYLNDFRKNSVSRKWLINLVVKEQGEHFLVVRQNHFILFVSPIQRISMRSESGAPDGLLKMFWICLWDCLLCWTVPKDLNESRRFLWWLLCIFRVLSPLIQHFCIHWAAKYLISGIRYVRIRWMKINLCA